MKFTEAQLEAAIIELLGAEGYPHVLGEGPLKGSNAKYKDLAYVSAANKETNV